MSRGRNYTVGERAVIAIGAAAGKTVADVNAALEADARRTGADFRPVNATSMGMAHRYPSLSTADAAALWDHVTGPKALGDFSRIVAEPGDLLPALNATISAFLEAGGDPAICADNLREIAETVFEDRTLEERDYWKQRAITERATIVRWLRATSTTRMWREAPMNDAADLIEAGEHRDGLTADTLIDDRLAALLDAERENTALRAQVAALTANGVSVHKAADAAYRDGYREGAEDEQTAVVAWLRERADLVWHADAERAIVQSAYGIERGEHNTNRPGRGTENA